METDKVSLPWSSEDIRRVEELNLRDGDNHLPKTTKYSDTPTWHFYERFIHILEGDTDFDFGDFDKMTLKEIDWQEIKIVTQKMKGEEPEVYDDSIPLYSDQNWINMGYVRDFLQEKFGADFQIPDPDEVK